MSGYRVAPAALEDLVERMAAFDRLLDDALARVESIARALATTWTGAASSSYLAAQSTSERDLAEMRAAVVRLRANVASAHANYTSAIAANSRMWR